MTKFSVFFALISVGAFALSAANATIPLPAATVVLALGGVVFAAMAGATFKA